MDSDDDNNDIMLNSDKDTLEKLLKQLQTRCNDLKTIRDIEHAAFMLQSARFKTSEGAASKPTFEDIDAQFKNVEKMKGYDANISVIKVR